MKNLALFFIGLLISLSGFSQSVQTETKIIFEDGKTKQWTISRKYDQDGNLIESDSSFTENSQEMNSNGQNFYFFQSPDTSFYDQGNFRMPAEMDSLKQHFFDPNENYLKSFEDFQREMQQMMKRYQEEFILPDTNFIVPEGQEKNIRRI